MVFFRKNDIFLTMFFGDVEARDSIAPKLSLGRSNSRPVYPSLGLRYAGNNLVRPKERF